DTWKCPRITREAVSQVRKKKWTERSDQTQRRGREERVSCMFHPRSPAREFGSPRHAARKPPRSLRDYERIVAGLRPAPTVLQREENFQMLTPPPRSSNRLRLWKRYVWLVGILWIAPSER